jgi:DNA-binding transcriptional LysR family regulator
MNDWAEFRHFRYLLAIVEHEGLRAAAEWLHTSPPNLSTQANEFQERFHIHLYQRRADNRISLTKTGVAFRAMARGLLEARDEVIAALVAIEKDELRTMRLGCGTLVDQELFHAACEMHKEFVPNCPIRAAHADTVQLVNEIVSGEIDAALATLPVEHPQLCVEEIRRDKLVVCLRADHPLAEKAALRPKDLQGNLGVLYHPQRHPEAHARLLELLGETGVRVDGFSRASHPTEMQRLVKDGYGLTLIAEGTVLDPVLTTRPLSGVDWTLDTAVVYHKLRHPATIPVLVRHLKRRPSAAPRKPADSPEVVSSVRAKNGASRRPPRPNGQESAQLSLLE